MHRASGSLDTNDAFAGLKPKTKQGISFGGFRNSVYTKDRSRIAQLYTNQDRIAQIINPSLSIRDKPPKVLPADKSYLAETHNMFLPATLRNKLGVVSPIRGTRKPNVEKRSMSPTAS